MSPSAWFQAAFKPPIPYFQSSGGKSRLAFWAESLLPFRQRLPAPRAGSAGDSPTLGPYPVRGTPHLHGASWTGMLSVGGVVEAAAGSRLVGVSRPRVKPQLCRPHRRPEEPLPPPLWPFLEPPSTQGLCSG